MLCIKKNRCSTELKITRCPIANETCVSFCNQPRHIIWLRQESLRHILASSGYTPGTIAVNVTRMERGFNARQTHCSMHPSIFNRFPVIQPVNSKVRHLAHFFAHFGFPWVRRWDNRGKCHTARKKIQCL